MAAYYWTTEDEVPAVYHNNTGCPEGKKILPENKESSDTRPSGRRLCERC